MPDFIQNIIHMEPFDLFVQAIGILAMITLILSIQFKRTTYHLIAQMLGCGLFALQFILLGNKWGGFAMQLLSVTRAAILLFGEKLQKRWVMYAQVAAALIVTAVIIALSTETGLQRWLPILPGIAQSANVIGTWDKKPIKMRLAQLCMVSPCWLLHNALIRPFTIGGILSEVFNICSVAVFFFRVLVLDKKKGKTLPKD